MKSVKILVTLLFVISLISLNGCGKKAEEKVSAKVKETEKTVALQKIQKETKPTNILQKTQEETKPTKAWTDDEWVEYWAQISYLAEKYQHDPIKMAEEIEKKIGMTSDEWTKRHNAWSNEWTKKIESNPLKHIQEWSRLCEKMKNRVEELKKSK